MLVMAGPEHLDIGMIQASTSHVITVNRKNAANILSETIFPKIN